MLCRQTWHRKAFMEVSPTPLAAINYAAVRMFLPTSRPTANPACGAIDPQRSARAQPASSKPPHLAPAVYARCIHRLGCLPQFRTNPQFCGLFRLTRRGVASLTPTVRPCANSAGKRRRNETLINCQSKSPFIISPTTNMIVRSRSVRRPFACAPRRIAARKSRATRSKSRLRNIS